MDEWVVSLTGETRAAALDLVWGEGGESNLTKFRLIRTREAGQPVLDVLVDDRPFARIDRGRRIVKLHGTGYDRWRAKRERGIANARTDGSLTDPETDRQAFAAERAAAELLDCRFNDAIYADGDGGHDFVFGLTVEVVWLGCYAGTQSPRSEGHLIISPAEPHRWADIYVVMAGSEETSFRCLGWTTHKQLSKVRKDFGYGERFAMHTKDLWPVERLTGLKVMKRGNNGRSSTG